MTGSDSSPNPMPANLDREALGRRVVDALNVNDWGSVHSIWLTGSFADPEKEIDRDGEGESDLDIVFVWKSYDAMGEYWENNPPVYDGASKAEVCVTTVDGTDYGKRTMDMFDGDVEFSLGDGDPGLLLPSPAEVSFSPS